MIGLHARTPLRCHDALRTMAAIETRVDLGEGVGRRLESRNPATGELLGTVPVTSAADVERMAAEVAAAQRSWVRVPLRERARVIERAAGVLLDRADEIAHAVTAETGKTISEAHFVDVGAPAMVLD